MFVVRCLGLKSGVHLLQRFAIGLMLWFAVCCSAIADTAPFSPVPPPIEVSALIEAPIKDVWNAWTTSAGLPTFMGLQAEIDAKPRGVFRVTFELDKETPLDRGNDGIVVAVEPLSMLSVTWMTPMNMPTLRGNSTNLAIYFESMDEGRRTRVRIVNTGYGVGPDWAAAYQYNVRGWARVLTALDYRFKTGPINWEWAIKELKKTGAWPWARKPPQ